MSDIVESFDQKANTNDIFMPSYNQSLELMANDYSLEDTNTNKGKLALAKLATSHKRGEVEAVSEEAISTNKEPEHKKSAVTNEASPFEE